MTDPSFPTACDVLVLGAGPAGSACARLLAQAGLSVVLADQHDFPRDKVCGDGLIPDAHAALRRLGVYDEIAQQAEHVREVRCIASRGSFIDVPGRIAVLPRKALDLILVRHAQDAGATLLTPWRFEAPVLDGERVVGARFKTPQGPSTLAARWIVLATGAVPQALAAAGMCRRHTPSGIALRAYVRHDGLRAQRGRLQMVWHPRLRGGYGWIFPAPGGLFNVGVGLTGSHRVQHCGHGQKTHDVNLRTMLEAFGQLHAPAAELLRHGELLGDFKGAPLRCTLDGALWSRPGLLVAGEAAGSTYAFTGEGIGKALETGMLAAEALLAHRRADDAAVQQTYEAALRALVPRFAMYQAAHRVNRHPWLTDIVVWRARKSPRIQARLAGILDETSNPGHLFSVRGFKRLLLD